MRPVVFCLLILLISCSYSDPYKPDVDAQVEDLLEYDDGYTKSARVTLKLTNSADFAVYTVTVAVSLETDKNTYYQTIFDDRGVPPHTTIWMTLEFMYTDFQESSSKDSIRITDIYCD